MRRVKQLGYLLTDRGYSNHRAIVEQVKARYESAVEVDHYSSVAFDGFFEEEAAVVREFLKSSPHAKRALVIGCGAGREAFALAKIGLSVAGIDISPKMVTKARDLAGKNLIAAEFWVGDIGEFGKLVGHFDFVLISSAIAEHLIGGDHRIEFYRQCAKMVNSTGGLFIAPQIQRLTIQSSYFWASQALRLKWKLKGLEWQAGDSARAYFGRHNNEIRPVYYHFYPDYVSFESEIREAGLKTIFHFNGGYLLRKLNVT